MDDGPYNLAILRHMALNLIPKDPLTSRLRGNSNLAAWKEYSGETDRPGLIPNILAMRARKQRKQKLMVAREK